MSKLIQFVKDDNTDRDFPDAYQIKDMMFKINGEYVCIDPCGGGNVKHLLGDQYIYVETWGSDDYPDAKDPDREGTADDPFLTIARAMEYVNTIVAISGNIYVKVGKGTFYIDETMLIDHPNTIVLIGNNDIGSSIILSDAAFVNDKLFWYGGDGIFSVADDQNEFINIAVASNSTSFGNMVSQTLMGGACSDGTYGIFMGGYEPAGSPHLLTIQKIHIATLSDATDHGDLLIIRSHGAACSDGTYGVYGGGVQTDNATTLEKITIAVDGNSTDFGDLSEWYQYTCAFANITYGIWAGGLYYPRMDRLLMATNTLSSSFGNLQEDRGSATACSSRDTGLVIGGSKNGITHTNVCEEVNIAVQSVTIYMGELDVHHKIYAGCCTDGVNAVVTGGNNDPLTMGKFTFGSTALESFFGYTINAVSGLTGFSGH